MWSIRDGDWKLIQDRGKQSPMLFNLTKDPGEKQNLASADPDRVTALTVKFHAWADTVETPRFGWWPKIGPRVGEE